ncbi:MAG: POTRA domain-containing protein, partial [Bacteroidota bacterium]
MTRTFFVLVFLIFFVANAQDKKVAELKIQGNKRTRTALVEKLCELQQGNVLDSTIIEKDMARLIRLPSVSHAYFHVFETEVSNDYVVVYGIEENFTLIPFANIFTSNDDEFAFRIGLQEFNFLGQNTTLGAFYQYDVFGSFGLNVRAPYLFSKKLGLA